MPLAIYIDENVHRAINQNSTDLHFVERAKPIKRLESVMLLLYAYLKILKCSVNSNFFNLQKLKPQII